MFSQTKVLLDNGISIEIIGQQILCFDRNLQAIPLTPAKQCILKVLAENVNVRIPSPQLYASYNNDSLNYTLKYVGPCVSKEIYTMPPLIREKIDNVRGKGYRLTGQRAAVIQNDDSYLPDPEKCILKGTSLQVKPVFIVDEKRKLLFEDIDRLFSNGHKAVFIRGLGGIGKSEFAKQYGKRKLDDKTYSTVVFAPIDVKRGNVNLQTLICDDVIFSITNFPKRNETVVRNNSVIVEYQNESLDDYFERKYAKIREICDKDTLIIIDNFDVIFDREIIRFLEGNYHVIITTRHYFPDIACPQIELEYMDHVSLTELFFRNCGRTDISADDPALYEIFDLLGHHTMAVEIFAKYMAEDDMTSVAEIVNQLKKNGSLANLEGIIQISSADDERKPFDYIRSLFDISSLQSDRYSSDFETILSGMALMPLAGVRKYDFLSWCGIKSAVSLNKLIQRSWVFEDIRDGIPWISMHSVVSEVMRYQFCPDFNKCETLIQSLHRISNSGYHQALDEVSYISPILRRILYLCPINNIEHYEIYLSLANYFAIREESEICVDILHSLQSNAEMHHITDPAFHGHLCEGYGYYYAYLGRYIESIEWRKKAIIFFEKTGAFPDRLQNIKREIVWCYIHRQDIPAAISAAEELDTWLSEAPKGTKVKGCMLHLKARLEYEQGHYETAIMYDTQALATFEAIGLEMDCGSVYHVLGQCHAKYEETFELGIQQLKKCLTLWQKHRTEFSTNMAKIHQMIADAYFENERYDDALLWYQKCIRILDNQAMGIYSDPTKSMILLQINVCKNNKTK